MILRSRFHLAFGIAALPAVIAGTVLFGLAALKICGLAVASALAGAAVLQSVTGRHIVGPARRAYWMHAAVIGLLLALTLPVSASWRVPVVGGLLAVAVGKELLGGLGNSLWHPALVGRAAVALLFACHPPGTGSEYGAGAGRGQSPGPCRARLPSSRKTHARPAITSTPPA